MLHTGTRIILGTLLLSISLGVIGGIARAQERPIQGKLLALNNDNGITKNVNVKANEERSFKKALRKTAVAADSIKGTVRDAKSNDPLPGVNVLVMGTTVGTATNLDGKYGFELPANADTLVFSYIGYNTTKVPINGRSVINVKLTSSIFGGKEVVVVGYGTQEKATMTGSISAVQGDDVQKTPVVNTTESLQGRLPGLVAVQPKGEPGNDNATLRIRGANTLGNNSPLIVVDGIQGRSLSRIDPATIESITVLKDASAAIYGSEAANGVILVTTKRGKSGKPQIKVNLNQGWNAPTVIPNMADAAHYAQMINEIKMYNGEPAKYTQKDIQLYRDGSDPWGHPSTDWFDATIKPWSPQSYANVSLSGGSDRLSYFSSLGYNYQDGIFYNSATNYSQVDLRSNLDATVTDDIKMSLDLNARQENRNYPGKRGDAANNTWWALNRQYPYLPAYWPTGQPGPDVEYGQNPVVTTTNLTGYDHNKNYILQANLKFDVNIPWVNGLSATGIANVDKNIFSHKQFEKPWYLYNWDGVNKDESGLTKGKKGVPDPRLWQSMDDASEYTFKTLVNYEATVAEKNNVKAMVGWERIQGKSLNFNAYRRYFTSTALDIMNAGGNTLKDNGGWASESARESFFGRFNYNYNSKYMAEFVFRYDGSYIFPENSRWGFFPGVSVGWQIGQENFWKQNLGFINEFKLRASWGQTGNDRIEPYQYLATYGYSGLYVLNQNEPNKTLDQLRTANPNITWEVANQSDVGFDGELLDGKISFSADYFYNLRSNILWWKNAAVPQTTGLSLPRQNFAKVENKGYEFTLGYRNQVNDFSYSFSLNGSSSHNKILNWDEPAGAPEWQKSTGHPMNTRLYWKAIGVYHTQAEVDNGPTVTMGNARPGDLKFADINGDGKIDGLDRIRVDKTDLPTFTGGFSVDLGYKNFDFSALLQGAAGGARAFREFSGEAGNFRMANVTGRWTPDNTMASKPRAWNRSAEYWMTDGLPNNTYWVRSTDYMRVKSVNLGYTFTNSFNKMFGITSLRVYVSGKNLFTISGLKDFDPESPSGDPSSIWVNSEVYPQNKTINFGATLTF